MEKVEVILQNDAVIANPFGGGLFGDHEEVRGYEITRSTTSSTKFG